MMAFLTNQDALFRCNIVTLCLSLFVTSAPIPQTFNPLSVDFRLVPDELVALVVVVVNLSGRHVADVNVFKLLHEVGQGHVELAVIVKG